MTLARGYNRNLILQGSPKYGWGSQRMRNEAIYHCFSQTLPGQRNQIQGLGSNRAILNPLCSLDPSLTSWLPRCRDEHMPIPDVIIVIVTKTTKIGRAHV